MEGSQAGLPVPPGFILSVQFFSSWFVQLKKTKVWQEFLTAKDTDIAKVCAALKAEVTHFSFTNEQKEALNEMLQRFDDKTLFAVRSSSPEEDLEGFSFAGGYETVLGVSPKHLEEAVKKAFASCLDYRIVVYKKENGFKIHEPKIAVVVQRQIASEVSGVGFSLNPVTNNYDDAVFSANWGLGETVVAGIVSPDSFIADKVSLAIKEKKIGKKELSLWLEDSGKIAEKKHFRSDELTLSEGQVKELTELIKKVELIYAKPVDIEWAFAADKLYLLQVRPITTFIPLPPEMITAPGESKRLYLDITTAVEGMSRPVSVIGTSIFRRLLRMVGKIIFARDITCDINKAIGWSSEGRLFGNVSYVFTLFGKKKIVEIFTNMEPVAARTIESVDEEEYKLKVHKSALLPFGLLRQLPGVFLLIRKAKRQPQETHAFIQSELRKFEIEARALADQEMPLEEFVDKVLPKMFLRVFRRTVSMFLLGLLSFGSIKKIVGKSSPEIDALGRALPYNVTTEMGLALSQAASLLPEGLEAETFEEKLKTKKLPKEFLAAWEKFLYTYGCRGSEEIDIASPRYSDNPKMLFDQLLLIRNAKGETPEQKFVRQQQERQAAYEKLYAKVLQKDPNQAKRLAEYYRVFETFGGYRETHKYYLIFVIGLVREKILKLAQTFVSQNRLDSIDQIFDLTLAQLDQAKNDESMDLRALVQANTVFIKRLAKISQPPLIIDSRGFIPYPPASPSKPGEYAGIPISGGVVRGRIKVLQRPDEKPLKKGEILVARSTDPGWTPLFVSAAGLIMEVGGVLQHGALVAREYGIPGVSGVEYATKIFRDGMMVELDGTAGVVRVLES